MDSSILYILIKSTGYGYEVNKYLGDKELGRILSINIAPCVLLMNKASNKTRYCNIACKCKYNLPDKINNGIIISPRGIDEDKLSIDLTERLSELIKEYK